MVVGQLPREEEAVLCEAIEALDGWIGRLPASSPWREAFMVIRRDVGSCVPQPQRLRLVRRG